MLKFGLLISIFYTSILSVTQPEAQQCKRVAPGIMPPDLMLVSITFTRGFFLSYILETPYCLDSFLASTQDHLKLIEGLEYKLGHAMTKQDFVVPSGFCSSLKTLYTSQSGSNAYNALLNFKSIKQKVTSSDLTPEQFSEQYSSFLDSLYLLAVYPLSVDDAVLDELISNYVSLNPALPDTILTFIETASENASEFVLILLKNISTKIASKLNSNGLAESIDLEKLKSHLQKSKQNIKNFAKELKMIFNQLKQTSRGSETEAQIKRFLNECTEPETFLETLLKERQNGINECEIENTESLQTFWNELSVVAIKRREELREIITGVKRRKLFEETGMENQWVERTR